LVGCLVSLLFDQSSGWFVVLLTGRLVSRLVVWSVGWLDVWLICWLVGWLAGWLVGWLVGWLDGWLAGWLVGWLDGFVSATAVTPFDFQCPNSLSNIILAQTKRVIWTDA
jgi:uncharacterized membrane protein YeaQ/YmgE (transglycosylase-associated protein family)